MHSHDRTLIASLGFADPDKKNPRHTLACQYLCRPDILNAIAGRVLGPVDMPPTAAAPTRDEIIRALAVPDCPPPTESSHYAGPDHPVHATTGRGQRTTVAWSKTLDPWYGYAIRSAVCEQTITKERGFVVGFWDVVGRLARWRHYVNITDSAKQGRLLRTESRPDRKTWEPLTDNIHEWTWERSVTIEKTPEHPTLYIEVKVTRVDVADIARQMALYMTATGMHPGGQDHAVVATTWAMHPDDKVMLTSKNIHVIRLGEPFDVYCAARAKDVIKDDDPGL